MVAETAEQPEPTMEEILASIRKIIATDAAPTKPDEEVLDLTEEVIDELQPEPEPAVATSDPQPEPEPIVIESVSEPEPVPPEPEPVPLAEEAKPAEAAEPLPEEESLLSPDTTALASNAFSQLSEKLHEQRGAMAPQVAIGNGQQTLEQLVIELMRPMLKDWLDKHLPSTVERLVQEEIGRITRNLND